MTAEVFCAYCRAIIKEYSDKEVDILLHMALFFVLTKTLEQKNCPKLFDSVVELKNAVLMTTVIDLILFNSSCYWERHFTALFSAWQFINYSVKSSYKNYKVKEETF